MGCPRGRLSAGSPDVELPLGVRGAVPAGAALPSPARGFEAVAGGSSAQGAARRVAKMRRVPGALLHRRALLTLSLGTPVGYLPGKMPLWGSEDTL